MARKHKKDEVLQQLRQKHDVKISDNMEIFILTGTSNKAQFKKANDLGNGSLGKIDFLVNYCGYRKLFVSEF